VAKSTSELGGAELYQALAPIYDDWQASGGMTPFALVTATKLAPLLEREARARAAEPAAGAFSFLDLGCGTGTLLGALRARQPGWRLTGVDASAAMLTVAAGKSAIRTIGLARAALARPLPFLQTFDAAGVFYDTLNHLVDLPALSRTFAALAAVIRPGGLLVFDVTNRRGFERWWRGRNDFRGRSWQVSVEARFDPTTELGRAEVIIARGGQPAASFPLLERHLPEREVARSLAAAGFTVERTEGWAPFPNDIEGKTWWVARLSPKSKIGHQIDTTPWPVTQGSASI
jgi:SAM-dependent methyltransferase